MTEQAAEQDPPTVTHVMKALREPFPPEQIGKKPKLSCRACRDSRGGVCDNHSKARCADCGNWITTAHFHVDFVGHADVTDRLLSVDPKWTWEPLALDDRGLPALDNNGGLWIRLTIAGVTRIGYGDADGKTGGDAMKETIGDAIKVTAMRFGVALDLWRREPPVDEVSSFRPSRSTERDQAPRPAATDSTAREMLAVYNGFLQDIRRCTQPAEVKALGAIVLGAREKGRINPTQYNNLNQEAAKKLRELEQK